MRKIIIAMFTVAVFTSCGPTKFEQENVKYTIQADGNRYYVVGEIKKLPNGCVSYQHSECGCGLDETTPLVTTTVCGTYKITKIR